ncbi:acyl-CoA dehydrogenase [Amycolatopsis alba]|uniref:Acyl-CoA dehydrogenase n=1 Tax=Amycolatopsis alba DSM 44262 TaxID=1125972 RepID=A0A229R7E4_AMYAL|nr:acyl-CoA dehydrogenase [Amycolatopsis alba]OXM42409.1 acyl-CoA dehydrogenase [Amycolatopsis alba DSM 44262]
MSLGLDQEHLDLRDTVRGLVSRHCGEPAIRQAIDAGKDQLPGCWPEFAELGLLGLHLTEEHGGSGYGMLELAVVVEELARGLVPGPWLPTTLASAVLERAGHTAHLAGLADGSALGAVALDEELTSDGSVVTGETTVLGGVLADVLVLPVTCQGVSRWAVVAGAHAQVTEPPSHDLTRRLASVTLDHVPAELLDCDARLPLDLAATLFAAEAAGIADYATWTAADYARTRIQFGRPIGRFQAVKHRVARMLARAEHARACAWDAARAWDEPTDPDERSLAAAIAAATSVDAGFGTVKDLINTLGGIGFTWEHLAGFYLRRAQTNRIVLGSAQRWHRRVGELSRAGVRRRLGISLPDSATETRDRIRAELAPAKELAGQERTTYLADRGYTAAHLPGPWGKGADAITQLVIADELEAAELEPHDMVIGDWVVPTLVAHGSPEQQRSWIPPSLRGDVVWCQLFSEPGAGSDLAGLSTRAEKVDGGWRITGQKVWTSGAHEAGLGILLARTDPAAPRHRGLSYFVLDMTSPGIEIRPLRELTGEALFNEVFLDQVFIPDSALVGQPGDGWKLARTTLANERVAMTKGSAFGDPGEELIALAGTSPDPAREAALGKLLGDAQCVALLGLRTTLRSLSGAQPGAESSIAKLLATEQIQTLWETAMEWQGVASLTTEPRVRDATWWFLNSRCLSIAGGTTDIQLNIIGERILGLPRDEHGKA